ncbi:MAG: hypothetical protein EP332_06995 [Bacteroidetes bacterium]|nr:MAG: hypothetical protein EP332_06995 [Bacteroidota bacterium]
MRTRTLVAILGLIVLSTACKEQVNYILKPQMRELSLDKIYNLGEVEAVLFDKQELASDSVSKASQQLFLKGAEMLYNVKHMGAASAYFKESIVALPNAKTYFELGNALNQSNTEKDLREADDAYRMAEYLGFEPRFSISYQKAINEAKMVKLGFGYEGSVKEMLLQAINQGFRDTVKLKQNANLATYLDYPEVSLALAKLSSGTNADADPMLKAFLKGFGKVQDRFHVDTTMLMMEDKFRSVAYDFNEFIPEMQNMSFGREVSHQYYYVAKVAETESYVAVIYAAISFWEELSPVTFTLSTFNKDGVRIASLPIACTCKMDEVRMAEFRKGEIRVETWERKWLHDLEKVPYYNNAVSSYSYQDVKKYRIADDGTIVDEAESKVASADNGEEKP